MPKRVGANRKLKNIPGKKSRNNIGVFFKPVAVTFKYGFLFIVIAGVILIISFILHISKKKILPFISEIEILKIKKIVVQGNHRIDSNTIISMTEIDSTLSLIDIPVKKIEDLLKTNCWIEDVNVVRRIPYTVCINVKERNPIAIVNLKNVYLIDKTGFLWPLKLGCYWDVPVVSGLSDSSVSKNSPRLIDNDLKRLSRFLNDIEKCDISITNGISQIDFSQEGIVTVKLASNPITVFLNEIEVGRSMENLNEILQKLENDSVLTTRYINLCYNNIAYIN